jgi:hypothetical protein
MTAVQGSGFAVRASEALWLSTFMGRSGDGVIASAYRQLYSTMAEAEMVADQWWSSLPPSAVENEARLRPRIVEIKTTTLPSHLASGDCECFCFDARTLAEKKELRLAFEKSVSEASAKGESYDALYTAYLTGEDTSRVYPNALLPDTGGRKGRWKIVVEFEPES